MKTEHKILTISSTILMILSLSGCNSQSSANKSSNPSSTKVTSTKIADTRATELSKLNYKSGTPAYVAVNHNKAKLNPRSWKCNHVNYARLDKYNRTSKGNTGWLDKQNVANDSLRTRQIIKPTGYHQKFTNNEAIINRGHEIAYSLSKGISQSGKYNPRAKSGDQNNPKNLFTQSAFSNQELQTIYESKVRNALKKGYKVVYSVQPVFRGNDQMAKGVHMQAISINHKLDFNVYIFNVQPNIKFNYRNGRSTIDKAMKVPTPKNAPHFNDNKINNNRYTRKGRRMYGRYLRYRHYRDYLPRRHYLRHRAYSYAEHYGKYAYDKYHHYKYRY